MGLPRRLQAGVAAGVALAVVSLASSAAFADPVRKHEWWLRALHVTDAWQSTHGAGVTVAVLDTGVDGSQPDLTGSVITGPDYTGSGRSDGGPFWGIHGTEVASLIAGHGHGNAGGAGINGVAPQAKILSVRVTLESNDPLLGNATEAAKLPDAIARGIRYAVNHGAQVIDLPLDPVTTGGAPGAGGSHAEADAVSFALAHHVVLVAPAGDSGAGANPVNYPAADRGVISVGAFDSHFSKSSFSSRRPYVTLTAAGEGVTAADPARKRGYTTMNSTSAASAVVAGMAALIRAQFPALTPVQVTSALTKSTRFHPTEGRGHGSGFGTADAAAALTAAAKLVNAIPSSSPGAGGASGPPSAPAVHNTQSSLSRTLTIDAAVAGGVFIVLLAVILGIRGSQRRRARAARLAEVRAAVQVPLRELQDPPASTAGRGGLTKEPPTIAGSVAPPSAFPPLSPPAGVAPGLPPGGLAPPGSPPGTAQPGPAIPGSAFLGTASGSGVPPALPARTTPGQHSGAMARAYGLAAAREGMAAARDALASGRADAFPESAFPGSPGAGMGLPGAADPAPGGPAGLGSGRGGRRAGSHRTPRAPTVSGTPPWDPAQEPSSALPWAQPPGAGAAPRPQALQQPPAEVSAAPSWDEIAAEVWPGGPGSSADGPGATDPGAAGPGAAGSDAGAPGTGGPGTRGLGAGRPGAGAGAAGGAGTGGFDVGGPGGGDFGADFGGGLGSPAEPGGPPFPPAPQPPGYPQAASPSASASAPSAAPSTGRRAPGGSLWAGGGAAPLTGGAAGTPGQAGGSPAGFATPGFGGTAPGAAGPGTAGTGRAPFGAAISGMDPSSGDVDWPGAGRTGRDDPGQTGPGQFGQFGAGQGGAGQGGFGGPAGAADRAPGTQGQLSARTGPDGAADPNGGSTSGPGTDRTATGQPGSRGGRSGKAVPLPRRRKGMSRQQGVQGAGSPLFPPSPQATPQAPHQGVAAPGTAVPGMAGQAAAGSGMPGAGIPGAGTAAAGAPGQHAAGSQTASADQEASKHNLPPWEITDSFPAISPGPGQPSAAGHTADQTGAMFPAPLVQPGGAFGVPGGSGNPSLYTGQASTPSGQHPGVPSGDSGLSNGTSGFPGGASGTSADGTSGFSSRIGSTFGTYGDTSDGPAAGQAPAGTAPGGTAPGGSGPTGTAPAGAGLTGSPNDSRSPSTAPWDTGSTFPAFGGSTSQPSDSPYTSPPFSTYSDSTGQFAPSAYPGEHSTGESTGAFPRLGESTGAFTGLGEGTGGFPSLGEGTGAFPAAPDFGQSLAGSADSTGAFPAAGSGHTPGLADTTGQFPGFRDSGWPASTASDSGLSFPDASTGEYQGRGDASHRFSSRGTGGPAVGPLPGLIGQAGTSGASLGPAQPFTDAPRPGPGMAGGLPVSGGATGNGDIPGSAAPQPAAGGAPWDTGTLPGNPRTFSGRSYIADALSGEDSPVGYPQASHEPDGEPPVGYTSPTPWDLGEDSGTLTGGSHVGQVAGGSPGSSPAGGPSASVGRGGRPFPGARGDGDPFAFGAHGEPGAAPASRDDDTGSMRVYRDGAYPERQSGGRQGGRRRGGSHRAGASSAGESTETFTAISAGDEAPSRGQVTENTETFPAVPPNGPDGGA